MTELELSFGGQGNGIYISSLDKLIKGLDLSPTKIAKDTEKEEGICMFHTRLASCGGVKDELCHPFDVEGDAGKYVVMHNGHWGGWWSYSDEEKSDTQTMANLVAKYGTGVLLSETARSSGVWVVWDKQVEECYVIRRSGTFFLQPLKKSDETDPPAYFHASEPLDALQGIRAGAGQIKEDQFYELRPTGKAKERHHFEAVTPEKTRSSFSSYGGWSGGSGNSYGYLYGTAFGVDGYSWTCYCKTSHRCFPCADHIEDFGFEPTYDDNGDGWDYLTDEDRTSLDLPLLPAEWDGYEHLWADKLRVVRANRFAASGGSESLRNLGSHVCIVDGCTNRTERLRCIKHADTVRYPTLMIEACQMCDEQVYFVPPESGVRPEFYICMLCREDMADMALWDSLGDEEALNPDEGEADLTEEGLYAFEPADAAEVTAELSINELFAKIEEEDRRAAVRAAVEAADETAIVAWADTAVVN